MITLKESVDKAGLDYLLKNIDTLVVKEERPKFIRYAERIELEGDFLMVKYHQTNEGGRLYAEGSLSLQGFSNDIKVILGKSIYHDIDICNTHPTLLYQLCQKNGWETPELRDYIENRDFIMNTLGLDKHDFLKTVYGMKIPQLHRLSNEVKKIGTLLYKQYPEIKGRTDNPIFSKLSLILQKIENDILMKMVEFFGKDRVGVLSYDGFLLYRNGEPPDLEGCEAYITDWKIKLVEKEIQFKPPKKKNKKNQ